MKFEFYKNIFDIKNSKFIKEKKIDAVCLSFKSKNE